MEKEYKGMQLIHMSYNEAVKFAGKYGMNSIIYNKQDNTFNLYGLDNSEKGLVMSNVGLWGKHQSLVNKDVHDIYWIGGKN